MLEMHYTMLADVVERIDTVDEYGMMEDDWAEIGQSINCSARSIDAAGLGSNASREIMQAIYQDEEHVQLFSSQRLKKSARVMNIRDRLTQEPIWKDDNGTASVFDVTGSFPNPDPFGEVVEWISILEGNK